jgi:mRNA interferase HigB
MRVIAKSRLIALATAHEDRIQQVRAWHTIASKAQWHDLSEVRQTFRHADVVGDKTVFNIKGNAYRLITYIHYAAESSTSKIYSLTLNMTRVDGDHDRTMAWRGTKDCKMTLVLDKTSEEEYLELVRTFP